jgi:hypothetical protein
VCVCVFVCVCASVCVCFMCVRFVCVCVIDQHKFSHLSYSFNFPAPFALTRPQVLLCFLYLN